MFVGVFSSFVQPYRFSAPYSKRNSAVQSLYYYSIGTKINKLSLPFNCFFGLLAFSNVNCVDANASSVWYVAVTLQVPVIANFYFTSKGVCSFLSEEFSPHFSSWQKKG